MLFTQMISFFASRLFVEHVQGYYGKAICAHINDLEGIVKACWAVFYHSYSHNKKHDYHPKDKDSVVSL